MNKHIKVNRLYQRLNSGWAINTSSSLETHPSIQLLMLNVKKYKLYNQAQASKANVNRMDAII